jgi:hypothetical protein
LAQITQFFGYSTANNEGEYLKELQATLEGSRKREIQANAMALLLK